jgi:PfaD family protein
VQTALKKVRTELGDRPRVGFNLLHNPVEPQVEEHTVDLYLEHGIQRASASAFMRLTRAVVRYRLTGIEKSGDKIVVPNKVFAKISRGETAEMFLRPAPKKLVEELVADGILTKGQAELAALVPMAEDVTMEADSGGHTDRRPLVGMLPVIRRLARTRQQRRRSTPSAVSACASAEPVASAILRACTPPSRWAPTTSSRAR